jgi:hypothetical protein
MNAPKETTKIAPRKAVSALVMNLSDYKAIIEAVGGKFISIDVSRNTVFFWDEAETKVLSLYLFAVTVENVRLTLKDAREPVADFEPLLPTP